MLGCRGLLLGAHGAITRRTSRQMFIARIGDRSLSLGECCEQFIRRAPDTFRIRTGLRKEQIDLVSCTKGIGPGIARVTRHRRCPYAHVQASAPTPEELGPTSDLRRVSSGLIHPSNLLFHPPE